MTIREDAAADIAAIREVNRRAFGQDAETALVDRLRAEGHVVLSLVAVDEAITGHILFSRLRVRTERGVVEAVSLAPMAVAPECQGQGIGSALVRSGLEILGERGEKIVIVLGHPKYYPRFGFSAAAARGLHGPYGGGDAWMALELVPGALNGVKGTVEYPEAFRAFE